MTVSVMISNDEFKQMISCDLYTRNRQEQQTMKRKLLDGIRDVYGDSYYRLKKGTKQAIDMMCWLASERGFVFAGDNYLGDRYDVTDKTIRNIAKKLRDMNVIITVYRRSTKQNGRGMPIHLFRAHPYFEQWTSFLKIESLLTDFQTDFQAEIDEKPCVSKASTEKKDSTKDLPLKSFIKNKRRKEVPILTSEFTPSAVPNSFVTTVEPFFNNSKEIYRLWGKVRLAHKISCLHVPVNEIVHIAIQAFRESVFAYKENRVKKAFTGYFFGTLRGMLAVEKRKEIFIKEQNNPLFFNFLKS